MLNTVLRLCQSEKEYTISEKNLSGIFRNKTRTQLALQYTYPKCYAKEAQRGQSVIIRAT
jgi:hypothetical protein